VKKIKLGKQLDPRPFDIADTPEVEVDENGRLPMSTTTISR